MVRAYIKGKNGHRILETAPMNVLASQRTYNNENHAARLLYTFDLASCRAHYGTPLMDARHDMVLVDVRRNRPLTLRKE